MNLIEQLGGYEKAKEWDKNRYVGSITADAYHNLLALEFYQYKRANNIFEVGDKVVVKAHPFWPEDYVLQTVEQEHIGKWYMTAWRHATDAEIKAGRRLT